jgi:hypothetical protein
MGSYEWHTGTPHSFSFALNQLLVYATLPK